LFFYEISKNYNGKKVLVFEGDASFNKDILLKENGIKHYPIATFIGSEIGLSWAVDFVDKLI